MVEYVVVVDEQDGVLGQEEKLQAHLVPVLHRAISVVLCHPNGALLVQQRAAEKYHSPGLWSNTCCGHPRPGEASLDAAQRRLMEEMGIECALQPACVLTYRLDLGGGLHEHELNRVFIGEFSGVPQPNPREVTSWKWLDGAALREMRRTASATTTPWFALVLDDLERWAATAASLPPGVRRAIDSWQAAPDVGARPADA